MTPASFSLVFLLLLSVCVIITRAHKGADLPESRSMTLSGKRILHGHVHTRV